MFGKLKVYIKDPLNVSLMYLSLKTPRPFEIILPPSGGEQILTGKSNTAYINLYYFIQAGECTLAQLIISYEGESSNKVCCSNTQEIQINIIDSKLVMQCLPLNIDILGEVQTAKIEIVILLINKKKKHKPETGEHPISYLNERKKKSKQI